MELEQLEYFYTLAKLEHVTNAAKQLSISQPALSRSIKRLENELGVPLFDRQGKKLVLNKYGQTFLSRVESILKEYEQGLKEINEMMEPLSGEISLGFLFTLGTVKLPNIIMAFNREYPKIRITFTQGTSYALIDKLKDGDLDICLVATKSDMVDIHAIPLWSEDLFLYVPIDHPFASRKSIHLKELENEPFISISKEYPLRDYIDTLLIDNQIKLRRMFEVGDVATIAGFVAAGLGVSILPDIQGIELNTISKINIANPVTTRNIYLAWHKQRFISPATQKFIDFLTSDKNKKVPT